MEGLLTGFAHGSFVLAACSLVASVVIFAKARVPEAIRFLRHKPARLRPAPAMDVSNGAAASDQGTVLEPAVELASSPVPSCAEPPDRPEPPTRFLPEDQAASDEESEDAHA